MVASSAEPETGQILSTAPTPTLAPIPTSLPNTSSESYDAGVASVSNSRTFLYPPSVPHPCLSSNWQFHASTPTCSWTREYRNTCFANAVLQLLVNSPPFWNLFRELGDLKGNENSSP
ncbi:hypothetical protein BGY98DRAFT_334976 [Russula aff. rugulosa BPL654]|nr:hypothetical protein BGY98DRAFT_334976 [Russula aff. rugulosa BPL654]